MTGVRRTAVASLVFMAALGLAGCGNASANRIATPASSPKAAASAVPLPQVSVAPGTFAGEAVTLFGQDKVQSAYQELADFTTKFSFQPDLMKNKTTYTAADFAGPREYMTDTMRAKWDDHVAKAIAGDADGRSSVNGLTYYAMEFQGYSLNPSGPTVVNQTITAPTALVEKNASGTQRLKVSFMQRGEVRYIKDGKPLRSPIEKNVTYWVVPAPEGSAHAWLIDGVTDTYKGLDDIPDAS